MRIMDKKMETTIVYIYIYMYWDNGKEHGNYCLGFRI